VREIHGQNHSGNEQGDGPSFQEKLELPAAGTNPSKTQHKARKAEENQKSRKKQVDRRE
jgi:hypothetical protein